ncbi:MAG: RibD family protein [Myxococcales bacterium]|nr:RibD family protein [Myxococcales bacterium]
MRPRVTLHYAQSLDGRIAVAGRTTKLSSATGVERAHSLRASHDAVLVGAETVRIDDPLLTVRAVDGPQPRRVVLTTTLDLPEAARLVTDRATPSERIVIGTHAGARPEARAWLEGQGVTVLLVGEIAPHRASLAEALAALHARGVERLLVEGGGRVITSLVDAELADELSVEIAPVILGDAATPAVGRLGARASVTLTDARSTVEDGHVFVHGSLRGAR